MLFTGLILVGLSGFVLINYISTRFTCIEKIGLSFPVGMAVQTFIMVMMDLVNIPLNKWTVVSAGLFFLLLISGLLRKKMADPVKSIKEAVRGISIRDYNFVWFLFIFLIGWFGYMNFAKTLYFPPFDRDSLAGFETIGFIIGQEGTIKGASIFNSLEFPQIYDAGSYITYAPFVQVSYAYVYLLGAETSKIIPALMFLFFLIAFYGAASRVSTKTGAAIATFFMMITPEFIAFSSLSITNVMHAVFASLAVIYMSLWFKSRQFRDLILCGLLLGLNVWTRTEGVVFIGAVLLLLFIDAVKNRNFKALGFAATLSLVPLIFWSLFLAINNMYAESIAIKRIFWDPEKLETIRTYLWGLYKNTAFFGWSFLVFPISILINIWFLFKKRDNLYLLLAIILSSVFYFILLYQINYIWDSMTNVLLYSAKRFFFCFIGMIWFYAITNATTLIGLRWLDRFLALPQSKEVENDKV